MPRSESEVEAALAQYLSRSGGLGWEASGLRQLALGWETDVYGFRAAGGGLAAPRDLVLRVYPGQNVDERAAAEAHALRRLGALSYPVPELLAFEPDRAVLGGPFLIMAQAPGVPMWQQYRHDLFGPAMMHRFCALFADLHRLDPAALAGPGSPWPSPEQAPSTFSLDFLAMMFGLVGVTAAFEPGLDRLRAWEPAVRRRRRCIIHGDFHWENILMTDGGQVSVIDWSCVTVDDPRVDLAWSMVLNITGGRPAVAEAMQAAYAGMSDDDLRDMDFFIALALLRRVGSIIVSMVGGAGVLGMRPGLEQQLRAQHRQVRAGVDLLVQHVRVPLPGVHAVLDQVAGD